MSEHRPYPPSSSKLAGLREQGEIPYSRDFLNFSVVVSAVLSVGGLWGLKKNQFHALAQQTFTQTDHIPREFFTFAAGTIILFALSFSVLLLVLNGLQTRFFFSTRAAVPAKNRRSSGVWFLLKIAFLLGTIGFFTRAVFVEYQTSIFEALLSNKFSLADAGNQTQSQVGSSLLMFAGIFIGALFIAGFFSLLVEMFSFRKRHSMTRSEVEAEAKEGGNSQRRWFGSRD